MTTINDMKGKTFTSVRVDGDDDILIFEKANGAQFRFYHAQDCCETVAIEEIVGDLSDLEGSPLTEAEEVEGYTGPVPQSAESYTWTFYKFATEKGFVTVRWLGESNGYYSESVSLAYRPNRAERAA